MHVDARSNKVTIIAEAGVNHNGSVKHAEWLIDVAAEMGADAVKFQTFHTDDVLIKDVPKVKYQITNTNNNESQYDMIKALELSQAEFAYLNAHCRKRNITFLSTPFDLRSLDFLVNQLEMSRIKIASNEITNGPLLLAAAMTGKPILLSTGMSNLTDIEKALSVIAFGYVYPSGEASERAFQHAYQSEQGKACLKEKVTLLHCTSEYPATHASLNLRAIQTLATMFGLSVGYSDHSLGIDVPLVAIGLGARVIEKHFTLSKTMQGPDHVASLDPTELGKLVKAIRHMEDALGDGIKQPMPCEMETLKIMRRSLISNANIQIGDAFSCGNMVAKQPGTGISPMNYWDYLGRKANRSYEKDEMIS